MSADRGVAPTPFEVIADALDEPAGRATFMRGLMLGALVGAAVVGSVLRARQARRHRPRAVMVVTGNAEEAGGPVGAGPGDALAGTDDTRPVTAPGAEA